MCEHSGGMLSDAINMEVTAFQQLTPISLVLLKKIPGVRILSEKEEYKEWPVNYIRFDDAL